MSCDFHIKLDGVEGESIHKDHKGEIEVLSWSWAVNNASSASSGGGSGKGKASPSDLIFAHNYDKASPVLSRSCAAGKHFKSLILTCRKSGDGQQDFLVVTLKEVFITSVSTSGAQGGDLLEMVTCSYKDVEFSYKAQDDKGGPTGGIKFGWNVATSETR